MPGRRRHPKQSGKGHTFVRLRHDIIDSLAFKTLSPAERAVYIEVRRRFNGFNNGRISMSAREAGELVNVSKNTAARALNSLVDHGLLAIAREAAFNQKQRFARRYRLTDEPLKNEMPTNDWRKWKPTLKSEQRSPDGDTVSPVRDRSADRGLEQQKIGPAPGTDSVINNGAR